MTSKGRQQGPILSEVIKLIFLGRVSHATVLGPLTVGTSTTSTSAIGSSALNSGPEILCKRPQARWMLVIACALLMFSGGCRQDEGPLGLNLLPAVDGVNVFLSDTFPINMQTLREGKLESQQPPRLAAGEMQDEETGNARVGFVAQLRLNAENIDLGDSLTGDSLVLILNLSGFYGDSSSLMRIRVWEVTEPQFSDSIYYQWQVPTTRPEPLGEALYAFSSNAIVEISEPQPDGSDSVFRYGNQIRIPLRTELMNRILAVSDSPALANNTSFLNFFRGIYVTAERVDAASRGCVLYFLGSSLRTGLNLYYQTAGKRSRFDITMNSQSARRNAFFSDPRGSRAGTALNPDSLQLPFTLVQAGGYLKTRVSFPGIRSLGGGRIVVVNKAQLVFPAAEGSYSYPYTAPDRLFLVVADSLGGNSTSLMPDLLEPYYGGEWRDSSYTFIINRYLQLLLQGTTPDQGLVLLPGNSIHSLNRVVLNTQTAATRQPRLILHYTLLPR
ncbi:MAG: DUF4270 domain-containing protein [Sphingomonadales bacterium]|nr:DUF4270 domain-containing protein [Sphingomonadales bacterium]